MSVPMISQLNGMSERIPPASAFAVTRDSRGGHSPHDGEHDALPATLG